jgi:hypothetical protein
MSIVRPNGAGGMSMNWTEQIKKDLWTLLPLGVSFGIVLLLGGLGRVLDKPYSEFTLLAGVLIGPLVGPVASWRQRAEEKQVCREDSKLYLDGKMQRYSLLFAVNGGAFAIAQLVRDGKLPGDLRMSSLALGAALFTVIMVADIWLWGAAMRELHGAALFRPVGQTILLMIGALLLSGWFLVGLGSG